MFNKFELNISLNMKKFELLKIALKISNCKFWTFSSNLNFKMEEKMEKKMANKMA